MPLAPAAKSAMSLTGLHRLSDDDDNFGNDYKFNIQYRAKIYMLQPESQKNKKHQNVEIIRIGYYRHKPISRS
jgi:hypothetical protein